MRKIILAVVACFPLFVLGAAPAVSNPFDTATTVHKTHQKVNHAAANDQQYGGSGYYTNV
jgi:hypothetical protein